MTATTDMLKIVKSTFVEPRIFLKELEVLGNN